METVKGLNECPKEYVCSSCVALFCILHYKGLNNVYFSLEYVELKAEAMPTSWTPSINPSTSAIIGLYVVSLPEQDPFNIWSEPILPFRLVRDLECEGLWYAYLGINLSVPSVE